jgi:hypothetical protein
MCDRLYEDRGVGATRREVYHGLGVALIESLVPGFDNPPARPVVEPLDDIDAFFHNLRFDADSAAVTSTVDLGLQMPGTPAFDFGSTEAQLSTPLQLSTPSQLSTPLAAMNGTQSGSAAISSAVDLQMPSSQTFNFSLAQAQLPTPPRFSTPPAATNGTLFGSVAIASTDDIQMTGAQLFDFSLVQAQLPTPPQFSTPPAATNGTTSGNAAIASTGGLQMTGSQVFDFSLAQAQPLTPREVTSGTPSGGVQTTTPAGDQAPQQPAAPEASEQGSAPKKPDEACEVCGYRPKGDPQWYKGSMAKHRRLQHGTGPPKVYKCPYPGCTSQYKNRPDNLRQHQIEKNHWVEGDEIAPKRPSKRRKKSAKE